MNLVADGGLLALPDSEGFADTYTLDELGKRMWGTMVEHPRSRRAAWFHGLLPAQQRALILALRSGGLTSQAIANELEVDGAEVRRMWNEYADSIGQQVVGLRLSVIAGEIQHASELAEEGLRKQGDWKGYWSIVSGKVDKWQSLGIVDRAAQRIEVTHDIGDAAKEELDRMLIVQEKERKRLEELKQIDVTVTDTLPFEEDDDGDSEEATTS